VLQRFDLEEFNAQMLGVTPDDRGLWLLSSRGRDRLSLVRVDVETGAESLVHDDPRLDLEWAIMSGRTRAPLAVVTYPGRQATHFFDPSLRTDLRLLRRDTPTGFHILSFDGYRTIDIDETQGAAGTRRSLRLDFALGPPAVQTGQRARGEDAVRAAARNFKRRDLSRYQGVTFHLKAAAPLIVQVVLTTGELDSPQVENWRSFVRAGTAWRQFRINFADLTISRTQMARLKTTPHLELGQVQAVGFMVPANRNPGVTRGTLWIDEVSFY
jgi:hypothetical protein